ncbi:unnamed protein product [Orchesella dallaii]|uniref:xanthine dehydrogenase n=1 Tax=Orchesella dallaii TaxID=48710 RepID=A0ABP1Q0Q4_9HEXA
MGDNRLSDTSPSSTLVLFVNGEKIIENNPNPEWTLLYFLRFKLRLCGTKEACGEGGCGACTVLQSKFDEATGKIVNVAINACITPLCSTHGTAIITTEGIGSVKKGLHPVQERIAKSHGTQCGFCTPGFVMSMYALLRNNPEPTEQEMEDAFQGNLCRCTGYRPIMQGYKSLCKKSEPSSANGCCGGKGKNGGCCMDGFLNDGETRTEVAETLFDESEFKKYDPKADIIFPPELQLDKSIRKQSLKFDGASVTWIRPSSLEELLKVKQQYPNGKCVGGNTELGIDAKLKQQITEVLIYISDIDELAQIQVSNNSLKIGSAVTLSRLQMFCKEVSSTSKRTCGTALEAITEMLHWFAGQQIRNVATLAGNIITASPISDLNPILMACGAVLTLRSLKDGKRRVKMDESFFPKYRTTVMQPHEILESIEIPLTQENEYVWSVKQARRREDDIAIVNSCMRVVVNPQSLEIEDASLVFGGMASTIKIAKKTSQFLLKKKWSEKTFDIAANELYDEMKLEPSAPGGMVAYRQVLTQSFLTKFFLTASSWMSQKNILSCQQNDKSATSPITQGDTSGVQLYQIVPKTQKVEDLIGRPTVHLSGLKHATGEAVYTDDEIPLQGQLYGALVGSPIAHGKIISIDASKALALPGVVDFLSAKSIPADQNIQGFIIYDEEIFASEYVQSQGQTVGIIVASDPMTAEKASKLVEMKFEELTPILTIDDAVAKESFHTIRKVRAGNIDEAFKNADEILEGEIKMGGQEHFYMELQSCIVTPNEDQEVDILIAAQGPDIVQRHVAKILKIPSNRIKVRCRRIGGSFGGKESRAILVALPTTLAAVKLGKSVRTVMNRWDDMVVTGGRHPYQYSYKVGFTKEGKILGIQAKVYSNGGCSSDASPTVMEKAMMSFEAGYTIPNWDVVGYACKTNLPSNTAFRGYGGPQASFLTENIIDAVAEKVGKSPVEIREMHLKQPHGDKCPLGYIFEDCTVRRCWEECVRGANYHKRKGLVEDFNGKNRWKKRGISATPMKLNVGFHFSPMNQAGALVMIYTDGSVGLNHGGTEMGQGLLTKMAQVANRALGIPIEKIYFTETSTDKVPNATATCGSFSSDLNGMAVLDACQKLVKRLEPFKKSNPNGTWEEWVGAAYFNKVNLSAVGFYDKLDFNYDFDKPNDLTREPHSYTVYGAAVSEVEIDCLTGDHSVLKTDIVIDAGESLNPAVDVGQIEGAFMQGYGLLTMEELLYSPKGLMLTKGPGMYKIPSMGDIPRQFNISMLRGAPNPKAVYSSKGIGEPPLLLASSIFFAIKEAIKAARKEVGLSPSFRLDAPATVEKIRLACEDEKVARVKEGMKGIEGKVGWAMAM